MHGRQVAWLLGALLASPAWAQVGGLPSVPAMVVQVPGPPGPVGAQGPPACGQGDLDANCHLVASAAALTALQAVIPTPSTAVPLGPTPTGQSGSGTTYQPADAAAPSLSRSTTVTTAADGTFSVTWAVPLASAAPVVNVIPINTASQPAICNVTARAAGSMSGKCWLLATQVLTALGATVNVATGSAANMSVMVFAREPTQ